MNISDIARCDGGAHRLCGSVRGGLHYALHAHCSCQTHCLLLGLYFSLYSFIIFPSLPAAAAPLAVRSARSGDTGLFKIASKISFQATEKDLLEQMRN